ncbi:TPA: site-specific integrase, partial [Campylobacter jejuni]|nr:site-specific integrase [Campylobacter jejuni]
MILYLKNTLLFYRRILLEFVEYLLEYQDEMQINDIKTTFLVNFINYLEKMAINYQKKTKITYLRALTSFFSFISDNNDDLF